MSLKLYNTLSRQKEIFKPRHDNQVGLYTCGPTVYDHAHLGNLRTYLFEDVLKRVLIYHGYRVQHVMNITDVGHLTSDADEGEDKIEVGARREKKTAWEIAADYTKKFQIDLGKLNILPADIWPKATAHIPEQIALIKTLEQKGYTYRLPDGIYFNTAKVKNYGQLAQLDIAGLQAGARVKLNQQKKNITDFALWKFSPAGKKRQMEWPSPWGIGFPGWHIECSAMAMKYLGQQLDIHCGAVDHLNVHHTNEIAQSEAATDQKFVNYWIHGEHLLMDSKKMSKSKNNYATLTDLINQGYHPLAFRYLALTSHYRAKLNFTWPSLAAAQTALNNLYQITRDLKTAAETINPTWQKKFQERIDDDLDMPQALALVWKMLKSQLPTAEKKAALLDSERIFGLGLEKIPQLSPLPPAVEKLIQERQQARRDQNWVRADQLRQMIEKAGFTVEDTTVGTKLKVK